MTVQTDLSSDTANEVKLFDGEGKQVTHKRLGSCANCSSCQVSCFLEHSIERGIH